MRSNTLKKIEKIIGEIEENIDLIQSNEKKKTSEVISILLNSNTLKIESNIQEKQYDSNWYFDMDELSKWKEQNNQLFRVDYYRNICSNRRFVAKFIVFFKRLMRRVLKFLIEPIVKDQNLFNASVTASINSLYNNETVTKDFILVQDQYNKKFQEELNYLKEQATEIKKVKEQLQEFNIVKKQLQEFDIVKEQMQEFDIVKEQMQELYIIKDQLSEESEGMQNEIKEMKNVILTNREHLEKLASQGEELEELYKNRKATVSKELCDIENGLENVRKSILSISNDKIYNLERKIDDIELSFLRAINTKKDSSVVNFTNTSQIEKNIIEEKDVEGNTYKDIDYFMFENNFRGSRQSIKDSQRIYIDYFLNKGKIIALGCGRGEFLELLQENNVEYIGVDNYDEFVDYCNVKGLNAIKEDAVLYLHKLEDESVGGIFAAQVVEHLKTHQLVQLCKDAYNKLIPGGHIIIETPNPTTLAIFMNAFYIDPSHEKPVHPKTMEYYLKQAGFKDVKILYTEHSKVGYRLPLLDGENIRNLSEFNDGVNGLSDILFGSQDYAIIAQK